MTLYANALEKLQRELPRKRRGKRSRMQQILLARKRAALKALKGPDIPARGNALGTGSIRAFQP